MDAASESAVPGEEMQSLHFSMPVLPLEGAAPSSIQSIECWANMNIFWSGIAPGIKSIWSDLLVTCTDDQSPIDCAIAQVAHPAFPVTTIGTEFFSNPCLAVTQPPAMGLVPVTVCVTAFVADPGQPAWGATEPGCHIIRY